MFSTQLTTHVGKDGILHLKVPLDIQDQDVEIIVVVHPKFQGDTSSKDGLKGVIGAWQGETLTRPPQGDYEARSSIDLY